jgi:hypothetical protein
MKLTHLSTSIDCFGIHEVTVRVDGKKDYTFPLRSEYEVDEFLEEMKHRPGKALNWLKKVAIKDGK